MKSLRLIAFSAAALCAAGPALAADYRAPIYKAPPPPPPVVEATWSGFYVGMDAGGSLGQHRTNDTGIYNGTFGVGNVQLFNESFNHYLQGAILGAQAGYNWQLAPRWAAGVETDWQWSGQKDTACVFSCGNTTVSFFGPGGAGFNTSLTDEQRLRWFGTARARFGYATPAYWIYATGGLAYGRIESQLNFTAQNVVAALFVPGSTVTDFSHTRVGWTVGGGIETHLWDAWSAKIEYLYVDLGSVNDSFTIAGGTTLPGSTFTVASHYDMKDHIIRAGLNYRFGSGPVVARY